MVCLNQVLLQMMGGLHYAAFLYQIVKMKILTPPKIYPFLTVQRIHFWFLSSSPEKIFLHLFVCRRMFFYFLMVFPCVP